MYDVIVVGARCAGSPLAMLLARAGHKVALVDRVSFPSDTMSTHFLWQRGAARLKAWGLLGQLQARGCAPICQITFDTGPVQLTGIGPAVDGVAATYCPRRTVLDAMLAEAAVQAGAELAGGFVVSDLLWSDGEVTGVRGHSSGSPVQSSMSARLVVGADGLHSTVAQKVAARSYRSHPPLTAAYYSYWSGISQLGASFHARPGRLILTWPTNDDLTCIYVAWPHHEFGQVRTDVESSFHDALTLVPGLREAVESGGRVQRFAGTGDLPNLYRDSAGPGWALAGDAGHHKDPCSGMGMSDAFLAADLLADAIDDGLTGRQPMDAALARYQTERDQLTANGFELTLATARLAALPAPHQALYQAAAEQPDLTSRIFGVLGGSVPVADVYSHPRIQSALTQL
jgi:2-polyprenyl-6-methoxyphenol hydroxylase-like FAD-dependent oxidoreductase